MGTEFDTFISTNQILSVLPSTYSRKIKQYHILIPKHIIVTVWRNEGSPGSSGTSGELKDLVARIRCGMWMLPEAGIRRWSSQRSIRWQMLKDTHMHIHTGCQQIAGHRLMWRKTTARFSCLLSVDYYGQLTQKPETVNRHHVSTRFSKGEKDLKLF